MDLQLKGKRALVTGATAGIGHAIARTLAAEGAEVLINGRALDRVDAAISAISRDVPGAQLRPAVADLSGAEGAAALIKAHPEVDILVNNVGIFEPVAFERIDDADWLRFFEINVMSGVRLSRHYLPRMKAANWGRVVFISSESGLCPPAEMLHYGMTKSAQLSLSRGLAETTVGSAVTVNAVLPGPTRTEGVGTFMARLASEQGLTMAEAEARFFAQARPSSLLQRFIEPLEVAALVAYVCSPLAAATNGAALRVDGGVVRTNA
ncbi:SDR family NAD(P)-dependent oxidoreductase [Methylibium sp.]|uniref:SDR family NAD(P)-dependent oxidoreductase n=1 Tax=Methylibium sp. TaxID=2067992 RepID=UPI00286A5EBB|nr:SDR family NAD(P)-dependent oxidoreductase [Methylibium sp.]